MSAGGLGLLDISIIFLYLLFVLWRGFVYASKTDTAEDYFLAGRTLAWPFIGLSLYASNMSSSTLIGLPSSGYATGISVFNYEWMGSVILIFFALFFLPLYLRSKVFTMPEFLEKRFDKRSRYYFSGLTIIANIGIDTAATLYAGSLVLRLVFPDISIYYFIFVLAIISGLYTMAGGLRAVVFTDAIQGVLLTIGSIIITVILFQKIGSWEAMTSITDPGKLSLVRPLDDDFLPWPTLFISLPILGFYFWCTNQHIVQRALGARSVQDGQRGALLAGLLKLPLLFIMVLPGLMAHVIYPDLDQPNLVYPKLMLELLPAGILGLVLTGFIAALMSTIDSALNSASTLATMDFYKKFRPGADQKTLVLTGRFFIAGFVIIASLWAPFIDSFPTLWEYLQAALAYLISPIVACFLAGVLWERANGSGAFYSLIGGNVIAAILLFSNQTGLFPHIHYLYAATIIFAFSLLLLVIISLATGRQEKDTGELILRRKMAYNAVFLPGTNRLNPAASMSAALLAVTVVLVLFFW